MNICLSFRSVWAGVIPVMVLEVEADPLPDTGWLVAAWASARGRARLAYISIYDHVNFVNLSYLSHD